MSICIATSILVLGMLNTVPVPPIGEYPLIPRHSPVLRGVASSEAEPKPPLTAWAAAFGREGASGKSCVEWWAAATGSLWGGLGICG